MPAQAHLVGHVRQLGLLDEIREGTGQPISIDQLAAIDLRQLHCVEVALPGVAIGTPLRMQRAYAGEGVPQRHAGNDQPMSAVDLDQTFLRKLAHVIRLSKTLHLSSFAVG